MSDGISNVNEIKLLPPLASTLLRWTEGIQTPHFHLHYYGFHDRPIQELVAEMHALICSPSLYDISPYLLQYQLSDLVHRSENAPIVPGFNPSNPSPNKLKIAFISSHFGGDEPHGLLLIDVIRKLSRRLFDVTAILIGPAQPSKDFVNAVGEKKWYSNGYSTSHWVIVCSNWKHSPKNITADFEDAMNNAINLQFPEADRPNCLFH